MREYGPAIGIEAATGTAAAFEGEPSPDIDLVMVTVATEAGDVWPPCAGGKEIAAEGLWFRGEDASVPAPPTTMDESMVVVADKKIAAEGFVGEDACPRPPFTVTV